MEDLNSSIAALRGVPSGESGKKRYRRWLGLVAVVVLAMGYAGAHYSKFPFPWIGAPSTEKRVAEGFNLTKDGQSFAPNDLLSNGDIARILVTRGKTNFQVLLIRCDDPCNSATTAQSWDILASEKSETLALSYRIRKPGEYYFWAKDLTTDMAMHAVDHQFDGNAIILQYQSGASMRVSIDRE